MRNRRITVRFKGGPLDGKIRETDGTLWDVIVCPVLDDTKTGNIKKFCYVHDEKSWPPNEIIFIPKQ